MLIKNKKNKNFGQEAIWEMFRSTWALTPFTSVNLTSTITQNKFHVFLQLFGDSLNSKHTIFTTFQYPSEFILSKSSTCKKVSHCFLKKYSPTTGRDHPGDQFSHLLIDQLSKSPKDNVIWQISASCATQECVKSICPFDFSNDFLIFKTFPFDFQNMSIWFPGGGYSPMWPI